ncbi:MAG: hypothetical protein GY727_00055 [Gammaproteobacteria bacterium]|nr:hypothetical protein [Gammaproteobacteria bacterium]
MKKYVNNFNLRAVKIFMVFALVLVFAGFMNPDADALVVSVVDETGAAVPGGYRWLLEEDNTHSVTPGQLIGDGTLGTKLPEESLSLSIHASHAPVVDKGDNSNIGALMTDDTKKYFLSILPGLGVGPTHALGGAPIPVGHDPVNDTITVVTNVLPLPTAAISVMVFHDNAPLNGAPDFPDEIVAGGGTGLAGWDILLFEAGGRYGAAGGAVLQDCFGNPLGTTYDAGGAVDTPGSGILQTGPDGTLIIRNLCPAKYGVQAVPPAGEGWQQTNTIEGTKTIDAWVKANEPTYFQEFGPPGHHVFIGFTKQLDLLTGQGGTHTISGKIVNNHTSRPPLVAFNPGHDIGGCWVGLNDLAIGEGDVVYAQPCNGDSTFVISDVPPGSYQLVVFDNSLDVIFGRLGVTVDGGGDCVLAGGAANPGCVLGDIPVFAWFGRVENHIFYDEDDDGFRDPTEVGMFEFGTQIRWRDGTIYQAVPTDLGGYAPYDEIFPFFHWMVLERDFSRFKATGVTITVDNGGPIDPATNNGTDGDLTPQVQPLVNPNTGDDLSRTETGEVLTQAFQSFLGSTSVVEWGSTLYPVDENGGISGVVMYAVTRAENDPEFAAGEEWEPGIPRVQVNLYEDNDDEVGAGIGDPDGIIDDVNGVPGIQMADVDNYPLGWADGGARGVEDIDHDMDTVFDAGDAVQITWTDSWDDNLPTGCVGDAGLQQPFYVYGDAGIHAQDCFEGIRTYNQVRPGVFDGGYAFGSYFPGGVDSGSPETSPIAAGTYIVEAAEIKGANGTRAYEPLQSEDINVTFGEEYTPSTLLLPPQCVGDTYIVPAQLTMFPEPAPLVGAELPRCDRKQVAVKMGMNGGGTNAAADFFFFTAVPKASRVVGFILDDFSNEFDPTSPNFGEKYAPPWLPVTFRDFNGTVISRVHADQWGKYNSLLPSTFTANVGIPSGMSPNMLTACMNDPGPILNPDFGDPGEPEFITDPYYDKRYSQFCYTFQYMPGVTTYLDTPVLPIAAFAGKNQFPLDCEFADGTPIIHSVSGPVGGPYVAVAGDTITITSAGSTDVLNPSFDGSTNSKVITRDFGFGAAMGSGTVTIDDVTLDNISWSDGSITGDVPALSTGGQLVVTRDNGKSTVMGVHVTVGGSVIHVASGGSVQAAIESATGGETILIAPGTYEELVIMHKNVNLQGWGAYSTTITGLKPPFEKLQEWRDDMSVIIGDVATSPKLCPNQEGGFNPVDNEPLLFGTEEGAVITVLGEAASPQDGRIDGLTLTGADSGGGIFVNCFSDGLEISNNKIEGNHGFLGGGIHVGHILLANANTPVDADNDNLSIHHNHITQNGTTSGGNGGGGGIALYGGTDNYEIADNNICGNFSAGNGGGIGHIGLSDGGNIARNDICFNQTFAQSAASSGGGIFIGGQRRFVAVGEPPVNVEVLSEGSGSVTIDSNLLQGNLAGSGDGGGIRLSRTNGEDVELAPNDSTNWNRIKIFNNMIVNNVSGNAGAVSMQDASTVRIKHNTIANNDSTATASDAFCAGPLESCPQVAGLVSRAHSDLLIDALALGVGPFTGPTGDFSDFADPVLTNNIILHNRSFWWIVGTGLVPNPLTPVFMDIGVEGTPAPESMDPGNCFLTDKTGYDATNIDLANDGNLPGFVSGLLGEGYFNGSGGHLIIPETGTALETVPAFDEGGNFIDVRFGPLTRIDPGTGLAYGDYHIEAGTAAVDMGTPVIPAWDFDSTDPTDIVRPFCNGPDIGADEVLDFLCAPASASTIVVTKAKYNKSLQLLIVFATSELNGTAELVATPDGLGAQSMYWSSGNQRWQMRFRNVTAKPDTVTVSGVEGSVVVPVQW